jgi:hypothetical protein
LPSCPLSTKAAGGGPSSGIPVARATRRSAQPSHRGVSLRWTRTLSLPQSSHLAPATVGHYDRDRWLTPDPLGGAALKVGRELARRKRPKDTEEAP